MLTYAYIYICAVTEVYLYLHLHKLHAVTEVHLHICCYWGILTSICAVTEVYLHLYVLLLRYTYIYMCYYWGILTSICAVTEVYLHLYVLLLRYTSCKVQLLNELIHQQTGTNSIFFFYFQAPTAYLTSLNRPVDEGRVLVCSDFLNAVGACTFIDKD